MSKSFFSYVWRFNAIAIAAVCCLALFVGAYAAFEIARNLYQSKYQAHGVARVDAPAAEDGAKPTGAAAPIETKMSISQFSAVEGTSTIWATLTAMQNYDFNYSSKEASSTRNIVFYDTATGKSSKLFPTDNQLLVDIQEVRPLGPSGTQPPKAFSLRVIDKDTNNDGVLSEQDSTTFALIRPTGDELTKFETIPAGKHLGVSLDSSGNTLVVLQGDAKGIEARHIDLASFKSVKTGTLLR